MVDFSNVEGAFQARSDASLKRLYRIYKLIDSPFLTNIGPPLLSFAFKIGLPISYFVKRTIFKVFCGGETLEESVKTMNFLNRYHVKTILDYAVEGEKNQTGFDKTFDELKHTIEHAGSHDAVPFVASKMTGIFNFEVMEKVQAQKPLSVSEQAAFERGKQRLDELCKTAEQMKTPLFIDAEDYCIQGTIDVLAESMMEKYNKDEAWVYTTAQLYRRDRLQYVEKLIERAREKSYKLGIKLVRGAYMEIESTRAKEKGYPNPIQPNKEATDNDFNASLALCVKNIDVVRICSGTHNEASCHHLTELMAHYQLENEDNRIYFAQLYGMSDHISFNLAAAGYNVAKYLPYGPVKSVMPYMMRRAQENTSIGGQASREVALLEKEIKRRGL